MKNSSQKIQQYVIPATPGVLKKIDSFYEMKNQLFTEIHHAEIPDDLRESISVVLDKAALTYSVVGDEISKEKISRLASMVCGPSYVSNKHPQPVDSTGVGMFPVLQIDLDWLGMVTERKFTSEILQLWWSPNDIDGVIVAIPKSEVDLLSVVDVDILDDVESQIETWIPYDWLCDERRNCYQLVECANIGVTYPDFEILVDNFNDEISQSKGLEDLINKMCNSYCFNSPKAGSKKVLFNLFGHYKSHAGSPWDCSSDICFMHTPQWASGMMDANIFMNTNEDGVIFDFNFSFGR